jgi:hypothetical protein
LSVGVVFVLADSPDGDGGSVFAAAGGGVYADGVTNTGLRMSPDEEDSRGCAGIFGIGLDLMLE